MVEEEEEKIYIHMRGKGKKRGFSHAEFLVQNSE